MTSTSQPNFIMYYCFAGQLAGAPIGGAIFAASGENWVAVTAYSGGVMMLGSLCILYGEIMNVQLLLSSLISS